MHRTAKKLIGNIIQVQGKVHFIYIIRVVEKVFISKIIQVSVDLFIC